MFFTEVDNYVDGGVIANNPTDYGMTAIQNFFRLQGMKLPIAMVVSIGTGVYPASKMGKIDAQDALFFGKQWLKPSKLIKKTQNLFSLLSNAVRLHNACIILLLQIYPSFFFWIPQQNFPPGTRENVWVGGVGWGGAPLFTAQRVNITL